MSRRTSRPLALEIAAELPAADEPLVPSASSSALATPLVLRRQAAWKGAAATGLPTMVVASSLKGISLATLPALMGAAAAVAPHFLLPYIGIGAAALLPALLALPIAASAAVVVRRQGQRDLDQARAAAAGAGMGAVAVSSGALAWTALTAGDLFPVPFMAVAAALGVGLVGSAAFSAVPREGRRRTPVPSLYLGLTAAGLGGPALLAGGAAWAGVATLLPFLSPWALTPGFLPHAIGGVVAATIALVGLAPVSYWSARKLRRTFPEGHPLALGAGLAAPPAVPFLAALAAVLFEFPFLFEAAAATVVGGALTFVVHAVAITLGLAREEPRTPRLPA